MKIEKVTAEYAAKFNQCERFGIISEGCTGVWGEGVSVPMAIADAERDEDFSSDGCWIMEIEN